MGEGRKAARGGEEGTQLQQVGTACFPNPLLGRVFPLPIVGPHSPSSTFLRCPLPSTRTTRQVHGKCLWHLPLLFPLPRHSLHPGPTHQHDCHLPPGSLLPAPLASASSSARFLFLRLWSCAFSAPRLATPTESSTDPSPWHSRSLAIWAPPLYPPFLCVPGSLPVPHALSLPGFMSCLQKSSRPPASFTPLPSFVFP